MKKIQDIQQQQQSSINIEMKKIQDIQLQQQKTKVIMLNDNCYNMVNNKFVVDEYNKNPLSL